MSDVQSSDTALRLAAELGLEPDDPLTVVILPLFSRLEHTMAQSTEAHQRWTDTNLELLTLLTAKTQETQALAQSFNTLSNTSLAFETHLTASAQHDSKVITTLNSLPSAVTQALSPTISQQMRRTQTEVLSSLNRLVTAFETAQTSNPNRFLQAALAISALLLAGSLAMVCYHFGHRFGFKAGQLDVAGCWFGSVDNADYWKQVRDLNLQQTAECQRLQQSPCLLTLPRHDPNAP